ncbi:hypothetical protein GcC1_015046 [Golovinomyces cichoracearum]|uniref:HTH CENPB-type domain-containing protein n=1 Tax=Golovinomyces cichoracearum TaxID=62708 RepID=A0A420J6M9_9PEZI|nr:hypothetical protein GcC1_015046 [Golovinomyces cichoracearum]
MNDQIRVQLCRKKEENNQGTVSNTLKRSKELLRGAEIAQGSNPNAKRYKAVTYPLMEEALNNWFLTRQEMVNMSGDLLKLKGG